MAPINRQPVIDQPSRSAVTPVRATPRSCGGSTRRSWTLPPPSGLTACASASSGLAWSREWGRSIPRRWSVTRRWRITPRRSASASRRSSLTPRGRRGSVSKHGSCRGSCPTSSNRPVESWPPLMHWAASCLCQRRGVGDWWLRGVVVATVAPRRTRGRVVGEKTDRFDSVDPGRRPARRAQDRCLDANRVVGRPATDVAESLRDAVGVDEMYVRSLVKGRGPTQSQVGLLVRREKRLERGRR